MNRPLVMGQSRRAFVQQFSAMTAGLGLIPRVPIRRLGALAAYDLMPDPDEAQLRQLALAAVDAARAAGASFADVRLTVARYYELGVGFRRSERAAPTMAPPAVGFAIDYGVRVMVGGVWGFANGAALAPDAIAEVARSAVQVARGAPARRSRPIELAPAPVVANGRWATPIERDPLTVSFDEQRELGLAAAAAAAAIPEVDEAGVTFSWRCPTIVFASTEGTLLVQRITHADAHAAATVRVGPDPWWDADVGAVDLPLGGYGYEIMRPATLATDLRQAAERALARVRVPRRATTAPVGRYDLVLGPGAVADLLTGTLAEALSLERALGFRAHREGTSVAAPPEQMLGRSQLASPLITLRADRSRLHGAATVGWDEEGVKPDEYTCIQDGMVVDYHTNRQTAVELAEWYRQRGTTVRSHGCARRTGALWPVVQRPNLTLAPGAGTATVDDLIADTKRGFYLERSGGLELNGTVDQQLMNAQYGLRPPEVRQIINGRLGDYVQDFAIQFLTPTFWHGVDALGGAATATSVAVLTDGAARNPIQPFPYSTVHAVPARVRQVNVLNTGRTQ